MKLLALTYRYYAGLALGVLALSVPVFYGIIQWLVIVDVDEALLARKQEIQQLVVKRPASTLQYLPSTDPNIRLLRVASCPGSDYFHDKDYYLPLLQELEPHRELVTCLKAGEEVYQLFIRQSLVEEEDFMLTITGLQTGLLLLLLLGLGLINRRITRSLWQPFTDALRRIRNFRLESDQAPSWSTTEIDEFRELHQSLTTLLTRNQQVYTSQKQFTENASHEMQTPLAIMSAELEVLSQTDDLPDDALDHVQKAASAVNRLSHINRALLLLTKIENMQYAEVCPVDIGALTARLLDWYADFIVHKQLTFRHLTAQDTTLSMNPQLADVLVGNLLKNAIRHNQPGGMLTCTVSRTMLCIENTGDPLPFPASQLFDRFVKNPALPDATGLGLAIVKQIADRYGLPLRYQFNADQSIHRFELGLQPSHSAADSII
ncbi:signal transduction histidine kinase [Spirosoma oryzae]|uniref:histidine kinase n=2 Tax=Spirosoma TaxID=107 RepID=D2QVS5_SPILD|nr:HAMP domain-containing sensor histidine kinase [Spirosoma oryzae]ADB42907.1 histidine kinase [Spirosoma linguale DSM 74]PRY34953.1 signal transduction histidine kinase [Spirosoma oryzae]